MAGKILIVDGLWSVVGSTNFDSRSFGLNDEVNLAALDPALAATLDITAAGHGVFIVGQRYGIPAAADAFGYHATECLARRSPR